MPLAGKTALVTGAARGIGRAIARKLANAGCDVVVNYYNSHEEAEALCEEFRALGRRAVALKASVGLPDSVDEMFAELPKHFGHLDIVVSNAASGVLKPAMDMTLKHWRWCMETNAFALNLLAQRALPMMGAGGRIIAMSSLGSVRAMPNYAFIGASKAALESLVRSLAQELGPRGVRVNAVSAGVVETDALSYFPNREELLASFKARSPAGTGADPRRCRRRGLPAVPAGSRDDQRPYAVRRRRLRDLGLNTMTALQAPDSGLAGKIALVTGGGRGIGRAIVERLAGDGVDVVFFYRGNAEAAREVVNAVTAAGGKAEAMQVDIADAAAVAAAVEQVIASRGRIDVLVNNAGIVRDNLLALLSDEDIRTVLDTNIGGVFNVTRAVVPHMISKRSGRIVNLSSVAGEKGGRGQANYAASKGAINAFTRAMAVELASRKITVNCVAPGVIETEMSQQVRDLAGDEVKARILLRRYGQAQDVAHAVWFLASRFADYITGEVLHVDGGFKME